MKIFESIRNALGLKKFSGLYINLDNANKIDNNDPNNAQLWIEKDYDENKDVIARVYLNGQELKTGETTVDVWEHGSGLHSVQTKDSNNNALGESSVAEGAETDAHSYASHTEGYMTSTGVTANYSHTEGYKTSTQGVASHAEGDSTVTNNPAEHAEGRYNKSNMGGSPESNTIHSIGIGNASGSIPGGERKNAVEVMQNGDTYILGIGGYNGQNIESAQTIQNIIKDNNSLIKVVENRQLVAFIEDDEIKSFNVGIETNLFPDDFKKNPEKYNLIIKVFGSSLNADKDSTIGYTANHFYYSITYNDLDEIEVLDFRCYDQADKEGTIYHDTRMVIGMGDIYQVNYEGKIDGESILDDDAYISIFLQKLS